MAAQDDQAPLINVVDEVDNADEENRAQVLVDDEGEGEGDDQDAAPDGGCKARCDRCCGKCIGQCQRDCSPQGISITCIHILIFLGSLMIAVVATVNKQKNFGMCLLEAEFNADSGGYSFDNTSGVMCDYTLYYGLCSSALAFLFIMVNWVAGLHKARRWLQIQIPLNSIGLLGKLVAGAMQTVGFFIWCDHLHQATMCPRNDPSCDQNQPNNRNCYNSSRIYDENRGDENRMQNFFVMVLTTMVGNWFTFVLWLLSTIAVAIKLVTQPPKDNPEDEDDDEDLEEEEDMPPGEAGALLPGGRAAAATNAGPGVAGLRQRPIPDDTTDAVHI